MHAGSSVANSQLLKEQQAAGVMQRRMLPQTPAQFGGFTLSYELYSANNLSGDFVDFVALPERQVAFLIADVAGHGASAALVTVALKSFVSRIPDQLVQTPAALLSKLNSELLAVDLDRHVCALLGIIDLKTNSLCIASAGSFPQPFLWGTSERASLAAQPKATSVNVTGKALGLFDAPEFSEHRLSVAIGDRLTVVTDGILEWLAGTELGDKEQQLAMAAAKPADQFWSAVNIVPEAGGVDDVTWFVLERHA